MAGRIPPAGSRENGPNAAQGALVLGCVIHDMGDFGAEPDKFTFTDSLLLIMILVNVFNSIKGTDPQ